MEIICYCWLCCIDATTLAHWMLNCSCDVTTTDPKFYAFKDHVLFYILGSCAVKMVLKAWRKFYGFFGLEAACMSFNCCYNMLNLLLNFNINGDGFDYCCF